MGRLVISCYRPKPGHQDALRELMRTHVPTLRSQQLVTDRRPIAMEAADGTIIEVFEWASQAAIDSAHRNPVVQKMWEQYGRVCDYVPVAQVSEATQLFSNFTPLTIDG